MYNKLITGCIGLLLSLMPLQLLAQDSTDVEQDTMKPELNLGLRYHMLNNKIVYLMASTKAKIDGKFKQIRGIKLSLYLDADSAENLIGTLTTDKHGLAKAILPVGLKEKWDAAPGHNFIAISEANKEFESVTAETAITKSRITIDTTSEDSIRTINVLVNSFDGKKWLPVKDVEMKVGIYRSAGGILSAGAEETYTTDSSGSVTVELNKTGLPGDAKGNYVLVAKVEENETLGNLVEEKIVPWGVAVKPDSDFFNQRTLWSTRFRTPFWLLFMAYSIIIGVWGTVLYLVMQIYKIKKLGLQQDNASNS
jgi:hypothetical protein